MTQWLTLDQRELDDAANVLLVAPEVGRSVESLFADLLVSRGTAPDHVVGVTTSKHPTDFLGRWREAFPAGDVSFSFVSTNGAARSVAADAGGASASLNVDVTHLEDLLPLSSFGIAISDELGAAERGDAVLCFHSLTNVLEYVDPETAFQFLHVVLSRVRTSGASGFYHIDSRAHDQRTIVQLSTLFDLVVEFDEPGLSRNGDGPVGRST